jgi:hypothetical protein
LRADIYHALGDALFFEEQRLNKNEAELGDVVYRLSTPPHESQHSSSLEDFHSINNNLPS